MQTKFRVVDVKRQDDAGSCARAIYGSYLPCSVSIPFRIGFLSFVHSLLGRARQSESNNNKHALFSVMLSPHHILFSSGFNLHCPDLWWCWLDKVNSVTRAAKKDESSCEFLLCLDRSLLIMIFAHFTVLVCFE